MVHRPDLDPRQGPAWLPPLLDSSFFHPCQAHARTPHKSDINMFCTTCCLALCPVCVAHSHAGHHILQARRSSYHDALRIADIAQLLNFDQIQQYTINGARIVFIQGRPPPRPVSAEYPCEICRRPLLDPGRFCALECKREAILRNPQDKSLTLVPKASLKVRKGAEMRYPDVQNGVEKGDSTLGADLGGLLACLDFESLPKKRRFQYARDSPDGEVSPVSVLRRASSQRIAMMAPLQDLGKSSGDEHWQTERHRKRKGVPQRSPVS